MATTDVRPQSAAGRRALLRGFPDALRGLAEGFRENDLGTLASAMAFQVLTAIAPLLLFLLGAMGFLHLTSIWRQHVRPSVADSVSPPVLQIVDDTVDKILGGHQLFWVTAGLLIATWQLSGAVRTTTGAMNRIYGLREGRAWTARYRLSAWLALVTTGLVLLAAAEVTLAPLVIGDSGVLVTAVLFLARWGLAAVLVTIAVGVLVHHAPDQPTSWGWTGVGSLLVMGSWLLMSGVFLVYLTSLASYGSIFGNLATLVVLLGYLYASALVFLFGLQMDALLRAGC